MRSSTPNASGRVALAGSGATVSRSPRPSQARPAARPSGQPKVRAARRDGHGVAVTDVDVVLPVYNEQRGLADSVRQLHRFLSSEFPFSWRIVIADNASTDETPVIARALADELSGVGLLRLEAKGRGRALRAAWSASDASVLCYMDVDLSTDLKGLLPLVAPLLSGHSDLAIGTRLAKSARVTRGAKREFISRSYNRLLRLTLHARFSDAQCGFKAVRGDVLADLLSDVRDDAWFFDTELLVLAQRHGLRIHEVPVDWIDDPDSSVQITSTALADLRGVARMSVATPIARFVAVGVVSTLAYALLFLAFSAPLGSGVASAVALALTAVANTTVNRRVTFGVRGRQGLLGQHAAGALVFAIALALTSGSLAVLHGLDPRAPHTLELTVLVIANLAATVTRYVALSAWVFKPGQRDTNPESDRRSLQPLSH